MLKFRTLLGLIEVSPVANFQVKGQGHTFRDFRFSVITSSIWQLETSKRAQILSQSKPDNFHNWHLALSGLVSEFGRGQSSGGQDFRYLAKVT